MLFKSKITVSELDAFERLCATQMHEAGLILNRVKTAFCVPFFTKGNLDVIVLMYCILKTFPKNSATVVITTYSITQKFVNQIALFKRIGLIKHAQLITSTNLKTLQPNLVGHVNRVFDEVTLCELHAKVITVTNGDNQYTVISSMNLTRNNKAEAGFISVLPQHFLDANSFCNNL